MTDLITRLEQAEEGSRELIEKLRKDLADNAEANDACEGCSAPLFDGDTFCSDEVSGCWPWVTGYDTRFADRPCYKYRLPEMSPGLKKLERSVFQTPSGVDKYITPEIERRLNANTKERT
jgi:hypothetical protein